MGKYFFDQYSILHFATGIIVYFWNFSLRTWILLHLLFELVENTNQGIKIINKYLWFWPGGKPMSDTIINSIGDTTFAIFGWLFAYYMDYIGSKYKLYDSHLA